ncbi:MAG: hypothetical protein KA198_00870 [Chitinophagaceae bacterium]|nr:hypothetical protein [Chitinophagaceae bacterium]
MDIGKYIGKFLMKNKYCSLPGLGVFNLQKNPAKLNVSNNEISQPAHLITFTPIGSIDDTFASFIAGFENVSISNASNNIKEYCIAVKEEVAKTGRYEIDHLGKLTMHNQKLVFQQAADLDLGFEPAPITPIEVKPAAEETNTPKDKPDYSYPPAVTTYRNSNKSWTKLVLPLTLLAVLGVGAYFGYDYYKKSASEEQAQPVSEVNQIDTIVNAPDTTLLNTDSIPSAKDTFASNAAAIDTMSTIPPAAPTANAPTTNGPAYNVAVLSFDNEASANLKAKKLKDYGNNSSVINKDGRFFVVISASHPLNDTTKLVDSMRRMYNPKGPVFILK